MTTSPPTSEAVTKASGAFNLTGLAPGAYVVHAEAEGYEPADSDSVEVVKGAVASIHLQLVALTTYNSTCESCHLDVEALLADLEADPLPEAPGEAGSAGEG